VPSKKKWSCWDEPGGDKEKTVVRLGGVKTPFLPKACYICVAPKVCLVGRCDRGVGKKLPKMGRGRGRKGGELIQWQTGENASKEKKEMKSAGVWWVGPVQTRGGRGGAVIGIHKAKAMRIMYTREKGARAAARQKNRNNWVREHVGKQWTPGAASDQLGSAKANPVTFVMGTSQRKGPEKAPTSVAVRTVQKTENGTRLKQPSQGETIQRRPCTGRGPGGAAIALPEKPKTSR